MKTIAIMISTPNGGIGINDRMPWIHLSILADNCTELAKGNVVLVGKGPFSSYNYLRGDVTYVYSHDNTLAESDTVKRIEGEPEDVINQIKQEHPDKNIIIAGGETVYKKFYNLIDEWRITIIEDFVVYNKDIELTNIQYIWNKKRLVNTGQDGSMNFTTYHFSKPEIDG
jgi:dihydrofolate reductase